MGNVNIAVIDDLKNRKCLALLVREHWLMGDCRGEAAALYLELEGEQWIKIAPDLREVCWVLSASDSKGAHEVFGDGDSHYPVRDVGAAYKLNGEFIANIYQKRLGERLEICLEFANATDITLHYNLINHESSFYFTKS